MTAAQSEIKDKLDWAWETRINPPSSKKALLYDSGECMTVWLYGSMRMHGCMDACRVMGF